MSNTINHTKVLKLVQLGVLAAIIIIMAFTPLGYFKTAGIEISLLMIPVVIGAIVVGPIGGAVLGGLFGITSFIQCFGMSAFGTFLFSLNPIFTFITCLIPRILAGLIPAYIFKLICRVDKTKIIASIVTSVSGALLNTVFFMLAIAVLFWHNSEFIATMSEGGFPINSFWTFMIAFVGINGLIEACVCFVVGSALSTALLKLVKANR